MNPKRLLIALLCIGFCGHLFAQTQDIDTELTGLAKQLATQIDKQGKKRIAVLDFTDLQGNSSELGRYIAEQLTVDFVMGKRNFAVLDRANLRKILAEHKLTAEGLVNPDNAKKLGQFAGVDALILGTIVPRKQSVELTAKVITTDTAEIVAAAKGQFKSDDTVHQFLSQPVAASGSENRSGPQDGPAVVKTFGDLRVELQSLHIVSGNPFAGGRREFMLTMQVSNLSSNRNIWVALNTDMGNALKGSITDPNGNQFGSDWSRVSGIAYAAYQHGGFFQATELRPQGSISATVRFVSRAGTSAAPGTCRLQLEFLLGHEFNGTFGHANIENLVTKMQAN